MASNPRNEKQLSLSTPPKLQFTTLSNRRGFSKLNAVEDAYRRGLRWSLANRLVILGSAAILTYVAVSLYPFIGSEMMPLADTGQAYAFLEMAPGTSFAATAAASQRFEQILGGQPEVRKVSAEIGEQDANGYINGQAMNGVNDISYMLTFSPKEERRRSIWQVMDAVYDQSMRTIPAIRRLALKEMGSDVMASNQAPVEIPIYGPDLTTLHRIADQVAAIARGVPGMVQVSTSSSGRQPEESIEVDRTLASQLGLTPCRSTCKPTMRCTAATRRSSSIPPTFVTIPFSSGMQIPIATRRATFSTRKSSARTARACRSRRSRPFIATTVRP